GAGISPTELSTEELPAELIGVVTTALRSPEATVDDALAVAIQIRERLADPIAVSGFGAGTRYEEPLFVKMTGQTIVDPAPEGGEEPGGQPRPTDVLDLEPKAVEESEEEGPGTPLSAEELKRLLEAGVVLKVGRSAEAAESAGIFARDVRLPSRGREEQGEEDPSPD